MINCLRNMALITSLTIAYPAAHAIMDKYRVVNRVSVLCASILSSTRALSGPESINEGRSAYRSFRESVLRSRPVEVDGLVPAFNATSKGSAAANKSLQSRVYSVERSFDRPAMSDQFVVATATLKGSDIDRLVKLTNGVREQFWTEAQGSDRGNIKSFKLISYIWDINQYFMWGSLFAVNGFMASSIFGLAAADFIVTDPTDPRTAVAAGSVMFLAAIGAIDFPVRHVLSHQYGFERLSKALARFDKQNQDWAYWSRDLVVSPEFARALNEGRTPSWSTVLRAEDYREQTSGLLRWIRDRKRKLENRPYVNFSIDVLARRVDGEPQLTIVLRTQPVMTPVTSRASVTSVSGFAEAN